MWVESPALDILELTDSFDDDRPTVLSVDLCRDNSDLPVLAEAPGGLETCNPCWADEDGRWRDA